jgi:hypothetical protein
MCLKKVPLKHGSNKRALAHFAWPLPNRNQEGRTCHIKCPLMWQRTCAIGQSDATVQFQDNHLRRITFVSQTVVINLTDKRSHRIYKHMAMCAPYANIAIAEYNKEDLIKK